ncbi:ABC transporter permease subunit [Halodesulfovibrio sp.]|jgi:phosphate transport system permease protein|uniref:PstA family ABC transporter permease n=1 Tax=Halodesulfovibrio sp. TaxID=1912772 RepID=UPI0025E0F56A|nr:ABC transporter permease subunit [Halodesulfovibrio sp.]MCT4627227.1 ABC transporter permease subunit [Halodesulfovibrio sp.]
MRFQERVFTLFCWLCVLLTTVGVLGFIAFLVHHGGETISLSLFFEETPPLDAIFRFAPVWDGIWPACFGTLSIIALAGITAIPLGIFCGIYLNEFGHDRWSNIFAFCMEVLAGIPSILIGLFGFALILFLRHTIMPDAKTCLLLSGFCMGLLTLPYMVQATQSSLAGVSDDLRLMGASLGFSKGQTIRHILLPSASEGIMSGIILSIGRAAEDTAVIMLTGAVANAGLPRSLFDTYEALPFFIYTTAAEYQTHEELQRGFGAALVLLAVSTSLFLLAHKLHTTMKNRWRQG